jgi:heme-degrading monooxygenase HmoA
MITRVWRGWTAPENADAYENLIRTTIFPGIAARRIAGLSGLELHRRSLEGETEFMTVMRFQSMEAVKAFAGADWEVSVVPPAARAVLARFELKASHFETRVVVAP